MIRYFLLALPFFIALVTIIGAWPWLLWFFIPTWIIGGLTVARFWWFMHTYAGPRPWWPALVQWVRPRKLPRAIVRRW